MRNLWRKIGSGTEICRNTLSLMPAHSSKSERSLYLYKRKLSKTATTATGTFLSRLQRMATTRKSFSSESPHTTEDRRQLHCISFPSFGSAILGLGAARIPIRSLASFGEPRLSHNQSIISSGQGICNYHHLQVFPLMQQMFSQNFCSQRMTQITLSSTMDRILLPTSRMVSIVIL